MPPQAVILEHTLASQPFQLRKDRQYAACRLCGSIFQSHLAISRADELYTDEVVARVAFETNEWRRSHNRTHSDHEHEQFRKSGRTFTPEAAYRLAPYGIVPIGDAEDAEIAHALLTSARVPDNNPEGVF